MRASGSVLTSPSHAAPADCALLPDAVQELLHLPHSQHLAAEFQECFDFLGKEDLDLMFAHHAVRRGCAACSLSGGCLHTADCVAKENKEKDARVLVHCMTGPPGGNLLHAAAAAK